MIYGDQYDYSIRYASPARLPKVPTGTVSSPPPFPQLWRLWCACPSKSLAHTHRGGWRHGRCYLFDSTRTTDRGCWQRDGLLDGGSWFVIGTWRLAAGGIKPWPTAGILPLCRRRRNVNNFHRMEKKKLAQDEQIEFSLPHALLDTVENWGSKSSRHTSQFCSPEAAKLGWNSRRLAGYTLHVTGTAYQRGMEKREVGKNEARNFHVGRFELLSLELPPVPRTRFPCVFSRKE